MTRITDGRKSENVAARKSQKRKTAGSASIGAAVRAAERGELPLDMIRTDGGTQSRTSLDGETINDYAEAMKDGAKFPAVTVFYDGVVYWLADGFHRVNAAKQAGLISLPVSLHQGTQRDAILFSVGANASHGKRRTNADKRQAVERLLRDEEWQQWSDRKIAEQCAVSYQTVANIRASLSNFGSENRTFTTKYGTTATMNTAGIGKRPALQNPVPASAPPVIPALPVDIPVTLRDAVDSGAIGRAQAVRMNNVLARLPEDVRTLALSVAGANEDKVEILHGLYKTRGNAGSNGTFDEIAASGGFHYGDEMELWCDFTGSGVLAIKDALKSLSKHHAQIEADVSQEHKSGGVPPALQSSESNEWYTPEKYVTAVRELMNGIDVDPASIDEANRTVQAATFYHLADDGLQHEWRGRVFLNPPYGRDGISNQERWTVRLIEQYQAGITTEAVLLVNAVTDRQWFQPLWQYPICFTNHRIHFYRPGSEADAPVIGSVFVYFGQQKERFAELFKQFGAVVMEAVR